MMTDDPFSTILLSLQGVTILAEPRVPRETIIAVLREHTTMIRDLKDGISRVDESVRTLRGEFDESRNVIGDLRDLLGQTKREIEIVQKVTAECRAEINVINEKLFELFPLKEEMKTQKRMIEKFASDLTAQATMVTDSLSKNKKDMQGLDERCNRTETKMDELKTYVANFGDNLMLSAAQVTVPSSAGFAGKTLSLFDVLKMLQVTVAGMETTIGAQSQQLSAHEESIQTKADESIVFELESVVKKVDEIEKHIKKEEEQGVSTLRKNCENLTSMVESLQFELTDKVSHEAVDSIVHKKYEEIVQYLQDALQATAQDEVNFKQKAEELREWVVKLSNSKADRMELGPMQEMIVRAEAMLNKLSGTSGTIRGEKNKESYTKKEIDSLMEQKVDRAQVESILQESGGRRGRRLAGQSYDVEDEALRMNSLTSAGSFKVRARGANRDKAMWRGISGGMRAETDGMGRDGEGVGEHPLDRQERLMWKGLADAMKEESEEAFVAAAEARGLNRADATQQYRAMLLAASQLKRDDGTGDDTDGDGAGGVHGLHSPSTYILAEPGGGPNATSKGSVKFMNRPNSPHGAAQDFRSYMNTKRRKSGGVSGAPPGLLPAVNTAKGGGSPTVGAAAHFPSAGKPGAFRVATEGGRPGGHAPSHHKHKGTTNSASSSGAQASQGKLGVVNLGLENLGGSSSMSGLLGPTGSMLAAPHGGGGGGSQTGAMSASMGSLPALQSGGDGFGPSGLLGDQLSPPLDTDRMQMDPLLYGVGGGSGGGAANGFPIEVTDRDTTFLGGQFVGGGFNLRAGNTLRSTPLMPLTIADPSLPDIVDNSKMVMGADGRLYIADEAVVRQAIGGGKSMASQ